MPELLEGKIKSYAPVTRRCVQLEIEGVNKLIELKISESWVINRGDQVLVGGFHDSYSGKFSAYAYRNKSKGIFGMYDASGYFGYWFGAVFIVGSILFCWAIFPLFFHLPAGIASIKETSSAKKFHNAVIQIGNRVYHSP